MKKFFVYWVFELSNTRRGYVGGSYGNGDARPNQHLIGTCTCAPGCRPLNRPLAWEFLAHCETWKETRSMEMACEREMRLAGYEVINHVFSFSEEATKKGLATRAAAGYPELKKALATRAAAGYLSLKKGNATRAATGYLSLKKGLATRAAAGYPELKKAREALKWKRLQNSLKNGTAEVSQVGGPSLATAQAATVIP